MKTIVVIGLGPGSPLQVTEEAKRYLTGSFPVYYRTLKHPAAKYYYRRSPHSFSFDAVYKQKKSFNEVYRTMVKILLKATRHSDLVCFAVPGHPAAGETAVRRLKRIAPALGVRVKVVGGLSFITAVLAGLKLDLLDGLTIIDALKINTLKEPCFNHLVIAQVYSRLVAAKIKLKLLELYPASMLVTVLSAAGTKREKIFNTRLSELDHHDCFAHQTSIYLPPASRTGLGNLLETMAGLRSEDGCPWDREQTHQSLKQYLVEEAYEVAAAIDHHEDEELAEELGDLLFQVVFHSQIAREENRFDFYDVLEKINSKMIRRHPHVFGAKKAANAKEVRVLWEEIKADEKKKLKPAHELAADYFLPALFRACKIQNKAAEKGFDWPGIEGPIDKAKEELQELLEAYEAGDRRAIEEELGDYLFSMVNIARFLKINPELALSKTTNKFINRFNYIMEKVVSTGKNSRDFSLEELDYWWEEAKNKGK